MRFGRVGIIGWPFQKPQMFLPTGQSSKTRFYNMLGKEDQLRKQGSGRQPLDRLFHHCRVKIHGQSHLYCNRMAIEPIGLPSPLLYRLRDSACQSWIAP